MSSIVTSAQEIFTRPVLVAAASFVLVASVVGLMRAITEVLEVLPPPATTRTTFMGSALVVTAGVLVVLWTIGFVFLFELAGTALRP